MGRHLAVAIVSVADVVAVVDNGQRAVYEVTRALPLHLMIGIIHRIIRVVPLGDGLFVQRCQRGVHGIRRGRYAMYVLRIDEAAADTGRDVDQVELHDTRDGTPYLLIESGAGALLGGDLQIHARGQGHLVVTCAVVTLALLDEAGLPVVIGRRTVFLRSYRSATIGVCL